MNQTQPVTNNQNQNMNKPSKGAGDWLGLKDTVNSHNSSFERDSNVDVFEKKMIPMNQNLNISNDGSLPPAFDNRQNSVFQNGRNQMKTSVSSSVTDSVDNQINNNMIKDNHTFAQPLISSLTSPPVKDFNFNNIIKASVSDAGSDVATADGWFNNMMSSKKINNLPHMLDTSDTIKQV